MVAKMTPFIEQLNTLDGVTARGLGQRRPRYRPRRNQI
jgi:hypothetical protein